MNAFLFVPLLALTWAFGLLLAMIASHYFLSVLESSGQGNDSVEMPVEPFVDWVGKVVYLGFFVMIWGIPSLIMMGATSGIDPTIRFLLTVIPFWLCFPVGMLSPLCLQSRWVPFWPGLLPRMAQRAGATIQLYLLSFPITLAMFYSFWQLTRSETAYPLIFVFAPLGAVCFLLYARLLGRFGFVLTFTRGLEITKVKKKRPRPRPRPVEEPPVFIQPTEMTALRDPFDEEVTGYGVDLAAPKETARPASSGVEEEDRYVFDAEEVEPVESVPPAVPRSSPRATPNQETSHFTPQEEEVRMFMKHRKVEEPKTPFGPESILFLTGSDMIGGLVKLSGGFVLFSLLIHFMGVFRPV